MLKYLLSQFALKIEINIATVYFLKKLLINYLTSKFLPNDYRTDISEGMVIDKTSASKECDICHYKYF